MGSTSADEKVADDKVIFRIEVPANRYDLLCTEGIATALRVFLGLEPAPRTDQERLDAAASLASRLGVVVVLKGAETVVSDGLRAFVEPTIDPALATAGSGDVLTGLCAGFASQFPESLDLFHAAAIAVRVHSAAAREGCDSRGTRRLISRELLGAVPGAIAAFESHS